MTYLEIVFRVLLTMAVVYAVFHVKDFFKDWYKWSIAAIKGMGKAILWIGKKIISIFKKEK